MKQEHHVHVGKEIGSFWLPKLSEDNSFMQHGYESILSRWKATLIFALWWVEMFNKKKH